MAIPPVAEATGHITMTEIDAAVMIGVMRETTTTKTDITRTEVAITAETKIRIERETEIIAVIARALGTKTPRIAGAHALPAANEPTTADATIATEAGTGNPSAGKSLSRETTTRQRIAVTEALEKTQPGD